MKDPRNEAQAYQAIRKTCGRCYGTGDVEVSLNDMGESRMATCGRCGGTGQVEVEEPRT